MYLVFAEVKEVASKKGQKAAAAAAARAVDISRLDIRIGHIISAEKVREAETRKLLPVVQSYTICVICSWQ